MKKLNNTKTIEVAGKTFELSYEYAKQETKINYTIEHGFENEKMEGVVEHKGYTVVFKKSQVNTIGAGTNPKIKKALENMGLNHYIMAHVGKTPVVVPLTEEQYNAIHETLEALKTEITETEEIEEKVEEKSAVEKATAEAKETGHKVILSRTAINGGTDESDTDIITTYVDGEGYITRSRVPME